MKVIVTGSEGFIGKALCSRIERERDVEVVHVDRKLGLEASDLAQWMDGTDCVFHLAAQTSVFNLDTEQIRRDNIDTFMRVADTCRRFGTKLVYASSSTAYELNTTSMYGMSKRFDEQYAKVYCPTATGCRLHNVYGPNPRQGTLLWHLMNDAEVTLYNGGGNIRCFTYIDDTVEGLLYARGCGKPLVNVVNYDERVTTDFVADLVRNYRPDLKVTVTDKVRELDRAVQWVDESVFVVPLHYKGVREGIRTVFETKF